VVKKLKNNGFSLTEVLMAVGILSIGMMIIATMFPVGIYLTTVGAERTMASIVIDEALAKIQLYGLATPYPGGTNDYETISNPTPIDADEFSYPSVDPGLTGNSQYYWSAICRLVAGTNYQVTVFVARKTNPNHMYPCGPNLLVNTIDKPRVIEIQVNAPIVPPLDELTVVNPGEEKYINPPTAVVDNATGTIYRVINRDGATATVKLEKPWAGGAGVQTIWLIPPPVTGGPPLQTVGKNAGVEVHQEPITF
jgi:prepilin-type N-terminal cleavage/methylation domain-containing protein